MEVAEFAGEDTQDQSMKYDWKLKKIKPDDPRILYVRSVLDDYPQEKQDELREKAIRYEEEQRCETCKEQTAEL